MILAVVLVGRFGFHGASMGYAHCHPQGANYPMGLPAPEDALREVDEVKAMFEQANYRVHDVLDVEVKFLGRCWR